MNILLSILHFAFITNGFNNYKQNVIDKTTTTLFFSRNYSPFGRKYYEDYIKNLNSKNVTIQNNYILGTTNNVIETTEDDLLIKTINKSVNGNNNQNKNNNYNKQYLPESDRRQ